MITFQNLLNPLFNDSGEVLNSREVLDNLSENNQTVPDLNKVFAFQTNHQSFCDLIMPFVADMPVILKIYSVSFIAGAIFLGHPEFSYEAWIAGTLSFKHFSD